MTQQQSSRSTGATATETAVVRLFVLDLSGGRVFSTNPDGSGAKTRVTGCPNPDRRILVSTSVSMLEPSRFVRITRMPSRSDQ